MVLRPGPMTTSEQAATSGGPVAQVPVALGGEGVVTTSASRQAPGCT